MPAGKHTSVRVALAVPPKIHEQLSEWADYEGRPLASLCMYLIENALRDAQREGIAPKHGEVEEELSSVVVKEVMSKSNNPRKNFTEQYINSIANKKLEGEPSPAVEERMVNKKEELLEKLISVLTE